jgi:AcrR family transcriptional regulator
MAESTTTQGLPKKQRQILVTAEELFYKYGIKRVTVEEICREANVSKMTFYKYFTNKITLAQYIWQTKIEGAISKLNEIDALEVPFPEKMERVFEFTKQMTAKMDNEFVKDFIALELDHLGQDKLMQHMLQIVRNAQQRGEIRPEIRPEFLLAMHDKTHELLHDEKLFKLYPDYTAFNREMYDFFCYGMLPKPSR